MSQHYLRTYKEYDIEDVKKHLLIMGDLSSDCASCRALGLDISNATHCTECGTEFKYVTSRRADPHSPERFRIVKRAQQRAPKLAFIDYEDYTKAVGQKKARDFFG